MVQTWLPPSLLMGLRRKRFWAGLLLGSCVASCGRTSVLDYQTSAGNPEPTSTSPDPPEPDPPEPDPPEPDPPEPCREGECADDGDFCNGVEVCAADGSRCVSTEPPSCDDGLYCNGVETCDSRWGCVAGEPVVCESPGASCDDATGACVCPSPFLSPDCNIMTWLFEQDAESPARDVAIEGNGLWLATDRGVDFLDSGGTPFDPEDDRRARFDEQQVPDMQGLQGVLVGPDGTKYFWGDDRVFAFDDGGSPFDNSDDSWVVHDTGQALWVSGVLDRDGILLIVARTGLEVGATPKIVVFDPAGTPGDGSDDTVATLESGLPGMGRTMAVDANGQVWVGTEADDFLGNLFHWDRQGTPLAGDDDVWTAVRPEDGRIWKLVADPTGGVWGTVGGFYGGVFQFFDGGSPTDLTDDYWHLYSELGSAMEIGHSGDGWFRMPGGAGILDVGGTPRDPSDDVARTLLAPDALRFQSDLYTNGTIDDAGRFWVVDEELQVFELVE